MLFILVTLIIMLVISPILTAMTFGGIIPIVIFSTFYQKWMRDLQRMIQKEKAVMSTVAEEAFSNIRTVKAFGNEDAETLKFSVSNMVTYNVGKKKAFYSAIFTVFTQLLLYGSMIADIAVASLLFKNGTISIGEITSFMFYMLMLVFNFMIVGFVFGNVASVVGASDKIYELMNYEPEIKTNDKEIERYAKITGVEDEEISKMKYIKIEGEINGRIELKGVKFSYPSKKHEGIQVLKGVDISVENEKNRVVALCGTSGCGKSSIIALIERFYVADEGEVLFNGVNVNKLDPTWYHNQIAIV